ncbi:major facilitator superfamily domain-containing protein [Radiomyces spectabilis]|uniref:major facilitator superfamily domain-containing protein n=1 Tax=Radiomyces spectabilis TaxID=64574 RepID=UPI00222076BC|nr:major facilitator superfamily domain-containing protein [Radiomyces spectabilis]KAI8374536.1 major facilitator superfamily domain-containing protein [Radiomyces spectabilis]
MADAIDSKKLEYNDDKSVVRYDIHEANEAIPEDKEPASHGGDTALANAPWQYKLIALVTALMFPIGSHFSGSALSAMKKSIKDHLNIDNTSYGVLSAGVSIINTIFPIAGGMFIDMFGSVWGTLVVNFMIILGSLLTALAAKFESYPLMIVARVVFGIGSGLIVTIQESLLSKWFRTQHLSFAIGLQLSISRLSTFLGTLAANPVANATGDWVWAFWLSFILCAFSIAMNLIYALVVKHLRGQVVTKEEVKALKAKRTFHWRSVFKFPIHYWHIILIEFIFAAVWSSFQTISTELVQVHFGTDAVLAGYKASASQVVPIVATPLLGLFMDIFGCRVIILLISAIFLILSSGLLGWTYVDAVVGMVFYSISLAFGPIAMITSIGMILPSDYIGTGLGIYKSSNNVGTTILDIVVGVIQDNSHNQAYTGVMLLFIVLAGIGFVLIAGLWLSQRFQLGNLLEASRKIRLERMKEINNNELFFTKQGLDSYHEVEAKPLNYVYVGSFIACLIVAWVLFFVYAIA